MSQLDLFDPEPLTIRRRCVVCGCGLSVTHTHTYVVVRQVWLKVGATNMPRRRINELSRPAWAQHVLSPRGMDWHAPLRTVAVLPTDIEHELHDLLADYHARGEWFWDGRELRRLLYSAVEL